MHTAFRLNINMIGVRGILQRRKYRYNHSRIPDFIEINIIKYQLKHKKCSK